MTPANAVVTYVESSSTIVTSASQTLDWRNSKSGCGFATTVLTVRNPADNKWYDFASSSASFPWIKGYTKTNPTTATQTIAIAYGMPASNNFADLNVASLKPTKTFDLKLVVKDATSSQLLEHTWQVKIEDLCYSETLARTGDPVADFTYTMLTDGTVSKTVTGATAHSCPVTHTLEYKTSATAAYTAFSVGTAPSVISAWNGSTGSVSFFANQASSEYATWKLGQNLYIRQRVTSTNHASQATLESEYIVKFQSKCVANQLSDS